MTANHYGYRKKVNLPFNQAVSQVKAALKDHGFGVLTEIDVKAVLKKKLDVDFPPYLILGACNPPNAHKALQAENEIGLMLPCNVIVYQQGKDVFVSAVKPTVAMGMINNQTLKTIAQHIEEKLKSVVNSL